MVEGLTVECLEFAQSALYAGDWFVSVRPDHNAVVEQNWSVGHAPHPQRIQC